MRVSDVSADTVMVEMTAREFHTMREAVIEHARDQEEFAAEQPQYATVDINLQKLASELMSVTHIPDPG